MGEHRPPALLTATSQLPAPEFAAALGDADVEDPVTLHGFTLPLNSMLTVRSFEMWTHEEDIRRCAGSPLVAPGRPGWST